MKLQTMVYRVAEARDLPAMASIRALEWGSQEYWETRIARYSAGELDPQHALKPRINYVASDGERLVGLIAGHLTRRHGCDGELEWINVIPDYRGTGVAAELLRRLAEWFVQQQAKKVCVDVEPKNAAARKFYRRHGASDLNPHWMVWNDIGVLLANR